MVEGQGHAGEGEGENHCVLQEEVRVDMVMLAYSWVSVMISWMRVRALAPWHVLFVGPQLSHATCRRADEIQLEQYFVCISCAAWISNRHIVFPTRILHANMTGGLATSQRTRDSAAQSPDADSGAYFWILCGDHVKSAFQGQR